MWETIKEVAEGGGKGRKRRREKKGRTRKGKKNAQKFDLLRF